VLVVLGGAISVAGLPAPPVPQALALAACAVLAPAFEPVAMLGVALVRRSGYAIRRAVVSIVVGYLLLAAGGGLALLKTGNRVRIDLKKHTADVLISEAELAERRMALQAHPYAFPMSQTPWQEIQRAMVNQLAGGMVLEIPSLIAMVVYAVIAWGLVQVIWLFYRPMTRGGSRYDRFRS